MTLRIERSATVALPTETFAAIVCLSDAAYSESTASYFAAIGPGEHLIGWDGDNLVSHLMWIPRQLQQAARPTLQTAYVEMVATASSARNRGYATRLLQQVPPLIQNYDIGALAPATDNLYLRLGWELWRGPLSHRTGGLHFPDPDERAMILRLPRTPAWVDCDAPLSVEWREGEIW